MKSFLLKIINFKTLFFWAIIVFSPIFGFSQATIYQTGQSGPWTETSTWIGAYPDPANVNASTIIIDNTHTVTLGSFENRVDLYIAGNATLRVCGTLIIHGNVEVAAILKLEVCPGANFVVFGNVNIQPRAEFSLEGYAAISGTLKHPRNQAPSITGTLYLGDCEGYQLTHDHIECGTLPIELLSFTPEIYPDRVKLNWTTGTEINNDYFTIERSRDLYGWEVLGFVQGAGNSSVPLSYSFSDMRPLDGLAYYRLKQTDFDGKFEYFKPVAAHYDLGMEGLEFKVLKQLTNWIIAVPNDGIYQVEVYNLQGHRLLSEKIENNITIPAPEGAVVIRVTDGFARSASRVVM